MPTAHLMVKVGPMSLSLNVRYAHQTNSSILFKDLVMILSLLYAIFSKL